MSVGSWALLGFALLGLGEVMREYAEKVVLRRMLPFLTATVCLFVAFLQNVGVI